MIKNRILLGIAVLCGILLGCSPEAETVGFGVDNNEITIDAEGGQESVRLSAEGEWSATTTVPWLSITPANGTGSADLTVRIDTTLMHGVRESEIRLASRDAAPIFIKVHQFGYGKQIVPEKNEVELEYSDVPEKRVFNVAVSSNVEFDVRIDYTDGAAQWLTAKDYTFSLDRGARPRTAEMKFGWDMNIEDKERMAEIHLVPKDAATSEATEGVIKVRQKAAPTITDDRQGDSLAIVLITNRLNSMMTLDVAENMMYWDNVELWEATDKDLPAKDAVGRVRYASFSLFCTTETLAPEIRHLKYCERLSFYGNVNTMLKSIALGSDVCELKYLKHLQVAAYGLVSLPDDFYRLGKTLETLDLNSNNFTDVPAVLTKENFPKLRKLNLSTCRRWNILNIGEKKGYEGGIGLNINFTTSPENSIKRLFLWDTLEQLALSYNYLEGELPEFKVGEDGVTAWTQADVKAWGGDTLKNMVGRPKILPRMKDLRINLNYFTGKLPEWILYHPSFMDWYPESFVYPTQENGVATNGKRCGFDNVPTDYEYYYNFFPGYREKYYIEPVE